MKTFIVKVTEHLSGYEFDTYILMKGKTSEKVTEAGEVIIRNWRECGETAVEFGIPTEVSSADFKVLKKYLSIH